jgi:hypothetical protein
VVFGNIIHTDAHDMYLARVAAIKGGLPVETPALTRGAGDYAGRRRHRSGRRG